MSRKAVKAESIEGCTHLTWEDDTGARESQKFLFTRGAIAWPKGMVPGIALIAGQNPDEKVEVFEEREFKTISEASRILLDWWPRYRPECYYAVIGDCTFVSDLEDILRKDKAENIQTAIFEENVDYGNQVVNEYLNNDRLSVPRSGILHHQFETNWEDMGQSKQLLHGIEALRYLMVGIKSYPWKALKKEQLRRGPLNLAEIAALDIQRAWTEASGEWDYENTGFRERP